MDEAKRLAMQAHDLHRLKKEAISYYQQNGAPTKMEESLNLMFKEKPECVFGYLSNFFSELANPPIISGVQAHTSFDSRGYETVTAKVSCRHKNRESVFGRATAALQHSVYEHDKQEAKDKEMEELNQHVLSAMEAINEGMFKELAELSLDPRNQRQIDELLSSKIQNEEQRMREEFEREAQQENEAEESKETVTQPKGKEPSSGSAKKKGGKGKEVVIIPDEPREGFIPGSLAVSALSVACAAAGSTAGDMPLYEHLRRAFASENSSFRLPLPMITILSGGKSSLGKSNCIKEYMLVPTTKLPYNEVLRSANKVYQQIAKNLAVKGGPAVKFVNDIGALNATLDRPEAGFDLINEALRSLDLSESFQLAINVAGQELFDYEKGKYDLLQGTQKTAEELVDFFDDLISKQPAIVAIIDPMRRVEKEAWMRLCHKISERCLVVGDCAHHRPGLLLEEEQSEDFRTSGWTARLQQRTTVSEIFDCAEKMRSAGNVVVAAAGPSDTGSSAIVDLAVALDARFLKIGAPVRSEKVEKFSRLVEIGDQLRIAEKLTEWQDLVPTPIVPPPSEASDTDAPASAGREKALNSSTSRSRKSSTNAKH